MAKPVHGACQIQNAEENQHQCDREFKRESEARRDDDSEEDDGGADHEDG